MTTRSTLLAAAICVVAACAGDDGNGPDTTDYVQVNCRRICEHQETCEPGGESLEDCTMECVAELGGWIRIDALAAIVDCTTAQQCDMGDEPCLAECRNAKNCVPTGDL